MEIESDIPKIPDFQLSEKQFLLQHTDLEEKDRQHIIEEILQAIKKITLLHIIIITYRNLRLPLRREFIS